MENGVHSARGSITSEQYVGPMVRIESRNMNRSSQERQDRSNTLKKNPKELADSSTSSDDEFFCQAARHLKRAKKVKTYGKDRTLTVQIEDVSVDVEADSGAEINVMDEHYFKTLMNLPEKKPALTMNRTKLKAL